MKEKTKAFILNLVYALTFILIGALAYHLYFIVGLPSHREDCRNLTLAETAECILDGMPEFYIYNLSNMNKTDQPIEELLTEGNVCYRWSVFYVDLFKEYGFDGEVIMMPKIQHAIALIYNQSENGDGTYCTIDGLYQQCSEVTNGTTE